MPAAAAIRTACIDGVWWLVNAAGQRFVSLGVNHVQGDCWLAPYNRQWALEKYGPDLAGPGGEFNPNGAALPRLMANVLATMRRWQFNTLGVHTAGVPPRLFKDDVYYVVDTNTQDLAPRCAPDAASPWWSAPRLGQQSFPDIFADSFAAAVEHRVRAVCELHRGQRNLIGYAFADIPRWYLYRGEMQKHGGQARLKQHGGQARPKQHGGQARPKQHGGQARPLSAMHPWVDDLRRLGPAAPGKRRWLDVLRRNHVAPADAARAYGAAFRTWEQATELTDWPVPADAAASAADCADVLVAMVERWYELHCGCLREHDDGHLILGDKLHSPADIPPAVLETVARHVDVLFIQWYAPFEQQRDTLLRLHAATGKPILNGDSSFAVAKPPHQTRVKGCMVDSLAAVGQHYHDYVRGIMSLPFMLGWHHCGWVEQWDGARTGSGLPPNENGLMDPFERPYEAVVERVIEANSHAAGWHAGGGGSVTA